MFKIFKKAGEVADKVKTGISVLQRFLKAFEAIKSDLDGDGKPEYQNIAEKAEELKKLATERMLKHKDLLIEDGKAAAVILKDILHRMEALAKEVQESALAKAADQEPVA